MNETGESWGRYPKAEQQLHPLGWRGERIPQTDSDNTVLPYGMGRSYGDSCLNDGGTLLMTRRWNHLMAFDKVTGILRCEAGVSLDEILRFAVPKGWFLSVTPGTKFVTVGGAIANDIHGKNHHSAGTFGHYVPRFELERSNGERLICSDTENEGMYRATIGGLGLTGIITWADVQLRKIESAYIDMESVKTRDLDDFFAVTEESDEGYEYTVSWLDCQAKGDALGRGIFMRGNHSVTKQELVAHNDPKLKVPIECPDFLLNPLSMKAFNFAYYNKLTKRITPSTPHYEPFFYPLDAIDDWNRIYGKRGFFQYQFVVPFSEGQVHTRRLLELIAESGQGSFLAVLKTFGHRPSPGILSFPRPGVTVALDFPNTGDSIRKLFHKLDEQVLEAGGAIYPAKDARMPRAVFEASFPNWQDFLQYIDPAFSSSFWRRVTSDSP